MNFEENEVELHYRNFRVISCSVNLVFSLGAFFLLYFNISRKQNKSLIPKLIILGFVYQSIISYCCLVSTNTEKFFKDSPIPKIYDSTIIFSTLSEKMIGLMKFGNFILLVLSMISFFMNEILYCFESIYLFKNPVSNTKYRKIVYIIIEALIGFCIGLYAIEGTFDNIKYLKTDLLNLDESEDIPSIARDCTLSKFKFLKNLVECSKYAFSDDDKYFGIIIQSIRLPLMGICLIYLLIDLLSVFIILITIKIQTRLFIYEKKIFRTRHALYSFLGFSLSTIIFISLYFIEDEDKKFINEKTDEYDNIALLIILGFNLFGISNSIIRLLEIEFFKQITLKGKAVNEDYNEKAIKQFLLLINDSEQQAKLLKKIEENESEKENVSKNLENKELNEANIKETLNPKKKINLRKKLSLSAQIACDYLSEAVYYIVSCITNNAINNKIVTSIIEDNSFIRCNEHTLKNIKNSNKNKSRKISRVSFNNISKKTNTKLYLDNEIDNDYYNKDDFDEKFLFNTNDIDSYRISTNSNKNNDISYDNYISTNEWETKSILLEQAKLGNFFTNFFSQNIRIIEYAPEIFSNILRFDKIGKDQIIKSFNVVDNILKLSSFKGSEGKSGSIFFETHDKKFIVKTIREDELFSMINSLITQYYTLFSSNVYSNLNRIYGAYTLILGISKIHVIVIENIFPFDSESLFCKFDLKGSILGRRTKKVFENKNNTLKDNDYIELSHKDLRYKISLTEESKDYINQIIVGDLNVLEEARLMDYSLFVCIAKKKMIEKQKDKIIIKDRIFESTNKNYVYILAIIDYLTQYGAKKKIEFCLKGCCNKKKVMSSINPSKYRQRFVLFLKRLSII